MTKLPRVISVDQLLKKKFKVLPFTGQWKDSIGIPEMSGVWIIWGHSGNGKTRFCLQLAKYLTQFGKVAYNTLEEGARKSMQKAIQETNMREVGRRFCILNREPIEDLKQRLSIRNSPDIIFIDSFQYTALTKREYIALKEGFPKKLFIFISHAEGKHPEGRTAKFVRYDADVKIRISGFVAYIAGRFGGGQPYTIWKKGAADFNCEID